MARIPIYTSKAPMQGPIVVEPHPMAGTQVAEAIGGLARTVGKGVEDWANAKAQDTAQRELASSAINYKSKMSNYVIGVRDNPDYNKDWETDFNKFEKETRGGIEFTSQKAKQVAERNFDNYRIAYKTELAGIDRQKYQKAGRIQLDIDLDLAEKMRDKKQVDLLLNSANLLLSKPAIEAKRIERYHDIEILQIRDALTLDPKADLSGFKNVSNKEKSELVSVFRRNAIAEANRLKAERADKLKKQQAELDKNNVDELREHTFTYDKLLAQKPILSKEQYRYFDKALATVPPEKSDPKVRAELWKRLGLGLLTRTDIMDAYGKLNQPDKEKLERSYTNREKNEWGQIIEPNKYQQATKEVDKTLNELVEDKLMSKQDMEEARTNVIYKLFDVSREKNLADDEIIEQKEKLMLPYYKMQSQLLNDNRSWNDFITGRKTEREKAEKKVEKLEILIEKEPVKEKPKEILKIEGIPPERVTELSDWLRESGKVVDEENIRLSYEKFK